jgi:hypothetical protein
LSQQYTLIVDQTASPVELVGGSLDVELTIDAFEEATGWSVKPEGFCRGKVCVPAGKAVADGTVDLKAYATLTGRPIVVSAEECAISLGTAAADRGRELSSLDAPDFTLPDLDGTAHSLSDYRGKKVLLAAYASW